MMFLIAFFSGSAIMTLFLCSAYKCLVNVNKSQARSWENILVV